MSIYYITEYEKQQITHDGKHKETPNMKHENND